MPLLVFPPLFFEFVNSRKQRKQKQNEYCSKSQHSREVALNENCNFDLCFKLFLLQRTPQLENWKNVLVFSF